MLRINSDQFNLLPFDQKTKYILFEATLLASNMIANGKINLYHYNGFYIQVCYDFKKMLIYNIEATDSEDIINKYLEQIKLPSFF